MCGVGWIRAIAFEATPCWKTGGKLGQIDDIRWSNRRFCRSTPPFPKTADLLLLGIWAAQPIGDVHDSYSFVLIVGLVGARN